MKWLSVLGERLIAPFLFLGAVWDLLWGRFAVLQLVAFFFFIIIGSM